MAELKTRENDGSVEDFLSGVENDRRREDAFAVLSLMKDVTGEEPRMWGDSIVGFGRFTHTYANGRELEWLATGFSPRKQSLTLYIMDGFPRYDALIKGLGKYKTGTSCLYINKLDDVDRATLAELIRASYGHVTTRGGEPTD